MLKTNTAWQSIPRPEEGSAISFDIMVQQCIQVNGEKTVCNTKDSGFAICVNGKVYAYRNHCPHVGSPLDWIPNQFFSDDGQALLCHTHGALFSPTTGECLAGPCPRGLYPISIKEHNHHIQVPNTIEL